MAYLEQLLILWMLGNSEEKKMTIDELEKNIFDYAKRVGGIAYRWYRDKSGAIRSRDLRRDIGLLLDEQLLRYNGNENTVELTEEGRKLLERYKENYRKFFSRGEQI